MKWRRVRSKNGGGEEEESETVETFNGRNGT